MIEQNVAPGVHRIEDAFVNWYLVEDGDRVAAVDAGLPASWDLLHDALRRIGREPSALTDVVLTHAHFDHVGFAERARRELGATVWVHRDDEALTRHPLLYRTERLPILYLWRPATLRIMASMATSGALWAPRIGSVRTYGDADELPVAGSPRVVFTPGHTNGHCSLLLADRDTLIAGDAVVTLDPYTALTGPRLVARAATADSARATASLDAIAATGVSRVLTGHGGPWTGGADEAARLARAAGAA